MADGIEMKLAAVLEKLGNAQRMMLWDVSVKEKLSPVQIQILICLDRLPREERTVSLLAREFDLTKPTVSDALAPLVSKGLVSRRPNPEDGRSSSLELTARGRKRIAGLRGWHDRLVDAIAAQGRREKESALAFLAGVVLRLFDEGAISVARMCTACENCVTGEGGRHRCALTGRGFGDSGINVGCEQYEIRRAHG